MPPSAADIGAGNENGPVADVGRRIHPVVGRPGEERERPGGAGPHVDRIGGIAAVQRKHLAGLDRQVTGTDEIALSPVVLSAMTCLVPLLLGEQVEQPLQLAGAGAQVGCQLGHGLRPVAAQRIEQLPVIVCGAAEFAAGALGK